MRRLLIAVAIITLLQTPLPSFATISVERYLSQSLTHFSLTDTAFEIRRNTAVVFSGSAKEPSHIVAANIIGWRHPDVTEVISAQVRIQDTSSKKLLGGLRIKVTYRPQAFEG